MKYYYPSMLFVCLVTFVFACKVNNSENDAEFDTEIPYPIHKNSLDSQAPLTYKGLKLELTYNGQPNISASDGVIGMVCIGMSNAAQECERYILAIGNVFADEVSNSVNHSVTKKVMH